MHPNKAIREAIGHAVDVGCRIVACASRTHCFARLLCPRGDRDGCHFWFTGCLGILRITLAICDVRLILDSGSAE